MNSIRKHKMGQFVLHDSNGEASVQLGDSIEVRLRTLNEYYSVDVKTHEIKQFVIRKNDSEPYIDESHSVDGWNYRVYTVEIVRSKFHNHDPVSSTNLVALRVGSKLYFDSDPLITDAIFHGRAFGQVHRLELFRGALTINGLLWDQGIRHVRDIAA